MGDPPGGRSIRGTYLDPFALRAPGVGNASLLRPSPSAPNSRVPPWCYAWRFVWCAWERRANRSSESEDPHTWLGYSNDRAEAVVGGHLARHTGRSNGGNPRPRVHNPRTHLSRTEQTRRAHVENASSTRQTHAPSARTQHRLQVQIAAHVASQHTQRPGDKTRSLSCLRSLSTPCHTTPEVLQVFSYVSASARALCASHLLWGHRPGFGRAPPLGIVHVRRRGGQAAPRMSLPHVPLPARP